MSLGSGGYAQIANKLISGIGGAVAGGLNAGTQTDQRNAIIAAYSNLPAAPNYQNLWNQGYNTQNALTPAQVYSDYKLRSQYAPLEQQQAYNLNAQYEPLYAQTNLATLNKVDPQYLAGYRQMGQALSTDLAAGGSLTPQQLALDNADISGAQAARGNVLGNANVSSAALFDANAQNAMYQQRLGNMSNYLASGGPESHFGALGGAAGQNALAQGAAGLVNPALEYYQLPQNLGNTYMQAGQMQWQGNEQNALAKAGAIASAPPSVNPWIASLSAGFGALAGNSQAGSLSGGSNNALTSYLSGLGGNNATAGNSQGYLWNGGQDSAPNTQLGETASPAYL